MKKKVLIILITVAILAIAGVVIFFKSILGGNPKDWGIKPENLPNLVTDKDLEKHNSDIERIYGFSKKDVSQKDLKQVSIEKISNISFDKSTKWPKQDKLPKGYNPDKWFDLGKDPGLNLNKIHEKGITGKGINVAVIDKPIRSTHNEFKDRMTYVKVGMYQTNPHFHGIACASILAGKTCGVAKDAKLYYFATPDLMNKPSYYIDAINKIIKINKTLLQKEKIKVISISDGIGKENKNYNKWQETLKKANLEGITVVYSNLLGDKFIWGGCDPSKDRNAPLNYKVTSYLKGKNIDKSKIIVPGDFRTTPSNDGDDSYVYWGEGGFSWAIPYITGLAALAWQVNPDLTFDEIISKLVETKTTTSEGRYIIDPEKFINSIS